MAGSEVEAPQSRDHEVRIYTETLARLYLKQGFVEQALAIYRRLVQEQPGNQEFHERLRTLEQQRALGVQGQAISVPPLTSHAAADPGCIATQAREYRVLAQLQRWLHYLQQQRQYRQHT